MSRRRISILVAVLVLFGVGVAFYSVFRGRPDRGGDKDRAVPSEPVPYQAIPTIVVQAVYPGADARTVAETVAAPIEEQVHGVEHMRSMSSQSANDGSYRLQITFDAGTDLDIAQVQVQNRVSLALPLLPGDVRQDGITVRKKSPEPLLLIGLTAPDNRYDDLFLGNYATLRLKDELARVPGVGDVSLIGKRNYSMRVWLNPDKLAARQLTVADVVTALGAQNMTVAGGPVGQSPLPNGRPFLLTITASGRLVEVEQLEGLILKASPSGQTVRLHDVARVELGRDEKASATFNARPAAVLSVYSLPGDSPSQVSRAIADKIADLRPTLPDGLALAVAFDFAPNLDDPNNPTTPDHLVVDVELPERASADRAAKALGQAVEVVRSGPGVQDVLALGEHPFSHSRSSPCLVVRLMPRTQRELGPQAIAEAVRGRLRDQVPDATFRFSVPSHADGFPVYGFPIDIVIEDLGQHGGEMLRERVDALVEAMTRSGKFSDVAVSGQRLVPLLRLDIDRAKCTVLGVDINDVFNTVQASLGPQEGNSFRQFGRTWRVDVRLDPKVHGQASEIKKLEVKNMRGQAIPLGTIVDVREVTGPMAIERHNKHPSARITANLPANVPLAEARSLCEKLATHEVDTKGFRLVWRTR